MNLNPLLLGNIRTNDYFKQLAEKKTFQECVDQVCVMSHDCRMIAPIVAHPELQIYYDVKMAVPWLPGTHNQKRTSGI